MEWTRHVDDEGNYHFTSNEPSYKKLVDNSKVFHYINREKVSMIYQDGNETIFVVDGTAIRINIHIENAHIWLTSWNE